jgi:hypothetical protein
MHCQRYVPRTIRWLGPSAAAFVALASRQARAEPSRTQPTTNDARAEILFNTAKQLQSGGQTADACDLFSESKRLAPGIGVSLHLADCYERVGRTASAWQEFESAERMARDRGDDKRADLARDHARALEPRLERLTLATAPGAAHPGWQVMLDGAQLPADHWNTAMAMDPGDHTVVVGVPGRAARTLRAHLDAGSNAVTLQLDEAPALPLAMSRPSGSTSQTESETQIATSAPSPPESSAGSGSEAWRTWAEVGLVGITAVGVGFGSFFMIRRGHFIEEGPPADPILTNQASTAATISFVASGVALTSAFVLFFTTPGPKGQVGLVVAPTAFAGGGGAIVRGSF